jgi:MAX-like protein X
MDTSNMQGMMTSSTAQQSVIQDRTPMNLNHQQQGPSSTNSLLYTATIYAQELSQSQQQQQQMMAMHQNRQSNNSQSMISDLNPFLSDVMNQNHQSSQGESADAKEAYKEKLSRGNYLPQIRKREPHNYEKCQPTAHQTTIYNQMLAQHQEPPQLYNNAYGANLADLTNINHMSPIQTTTNNFNNPAAATMTTQNVLNLSNNYANKMMMPMNQMQMEQQQQQQQQQQHESYKSPQSPSYRYHGAQHGNQPYKIPSQNAGYNATSRIMMRQQSPPHSSGGKTMSFQQQNASAAAMKEMFRSNSLPINANIQLPSKEVDFAVPKYPQAAKKERRSSAINLRQGQMLMPPLQSAASEPALNVNTSALAQLLTNPASLLTSSKAHSVSSSAMAASVPPQPIRANSFTSSSLIQNSILMAAQKIQPQQQPSSSSVYTPTLSPDSAFQDTHDMSSHSPERSLSLGKYQPRESQRRAGHIHAEQKRRYNIKNGFDMLHSLIPQLQQNPNAKVRRD